MMRGKCGLIHPSSFIIHHLPCLPHIARMPAAPPARVSSEILDRLPPHNLDAEKGVLGSVLLDPNLCDDVVCAPASRRLLRRRQPEALRPPAGDARRGGADRHHAAAWNGCGPAGDLEAIGGAAYLAEVLHSVPHAANAVYYAEIVRDKATLRALIHASTEILRDAYEPTLDPREMVGRAEEMIFAVHDQRSTDQVTNAHDLLVRGVRPHRRPDAAGEGVGVPTGFQDLDNLTGGLHDSEFVVLAARPSMGKTALATNIAEYVSIAGERAHAVREPGDGPAGVGPADALLAGADRRQQVPQRHPVVERPSTRWSRRRPS